MSDELNISPGVGSSGVVAGVPAPGATAKLPDALYMPRRGSFELHGVSGRAFYVWKDGTFNDDKLSLVGVAALPIGGGMIGTVYRVIGAKFYIFFGDDKIAVTQDFGLAVYGMFWSVDNRTFFPWPTSYGALRFTVARATTAGAAATGSGENVAQEVGSGSSFERHGLTWKISLSHSDVVKLNEDAAYAAGLVSEPDIVAAIEAGVAIIDTVDTLGGNRGVDITGVLPTTSIFVTPRGSIDIIRVIEIVAGVVTKTLTELDAGVKDGLKQASDALSKVSGEAGKVFKGIEDLGKKINIKI